MRVINFPIRNKKTKKNPLVNIRVSCPFKGLIMDPNAGTTVDCKGGAGWPSG